MCILGSPGAHVHCKEKGLEMRLLGQRKEKDVWGEGAGGGDECGKCCTHLS